MNRLPAKGFMLLAALLLLPCLFLLGWRGAAAARVTAGDVAGQGASLPPPQQVASPSQPAGASDLNCRYGVAAWPGTRPWLETLGAGWYLDFFNGGGGATSEYIQVVRVSQDKSGGVYLPTYTISPPLTNGGLGALVDANPGALWMVGNEVDRGPNPGEIEGGQDDTFPNVYAQAYHDVYHFIKGRDPAAQVANAGLVEVTPGRLQYLEMVWDSYLAIYGTPMPVDVWNMHIYVLAEVDANGQPNGIASVALGTDPALGKRESGNDPAQCARDDVYCLAEHDDPPLFAEQVLAMRQWMKDHGQQRKPLILSEYGILFPYIPEGNGCFLMDEYGYCFTPSRVNLFMDETFKYMEETTDPALGYPADNNRLVQQWLWFSMQTDAVGQSSNLLVSNYEDYPPGSQAALTEMGLNYQSEVAARPLTVNLKAGSAIGGWARTDVPTGTVDITLRATFYNNGNSSISAPFTVTFYKNAGLTQVIGSQTFNPVVNGCARRTYEASVTWNDLPTGVHRYWVKVDSASSIAESNESAADNVVKSFVIVNPDGQLLAPVLTR